MIVIKTDKEKFFKKALLLRNFKNPIILIYDRELPV